MWHLHGGGLRESQPQRAPLRDPLQLQPKAIPKKKKCKTPKWVSAEALQIVEKRREGKGKGEKERYIHLNAEFQRARRDKKAFLSDKCKEMEEDNRMGKTRDLFKKIEIPRDYFMQRWAQ